MPSHLKGTSPVRTQTQLTTAAAVIPARVPAQLTPPSVPAATSSQVVIRRAFALRAWPSSLETVSAAASESAAETARRKTAFAVSADKPGTTCGHREVGENLQGGSAVPLFGGSQLLFAAITEAGGDPGQRENRHQRHKCAGSGADVQQKAHYGSRHGAGKTYSSQPAGQGSEYHGDDRGRPKRTHCGEFRKTLYASGQVSHREDCRSNWLVAVQAPSPIIPSIGLRPVQPQCIVLSLWVTVASFVHQRVGCSLNSRSRACGVGVAGNAARAWTPAPTLPNTG